MTIQKNIWIGSSSQSKSYEWSYTDMLITKLEIKNVLNKKTKFDLYCLKSKYFENGDKAWRLFAYRLQTDSHNILHQFDSWTTNCGVFGHHDWGYGFNSRDTRWERIEQETLDILSVIIPRMTETELKLESMVRQDTMTLKLYKLQNIRKKLERCSKKLGIRLRYILGNRRMWSCLENTDLDLQSI